MKKLAKKILQDVNDSASAKIAGLATELAEGAGSGAKSLLNRAGQDIDAIARIAYDSVMGKAWAADPNMRNIEALARAGGALSGGVLGGAASLALAPATAGLSIIPGILGGAAIGSRISGAATTLNSKLLNFIGPHFRSKGNDGLRSGVFGTPWNTAPTLADMEAALRGIDGINGAILGGAAIPIVGAPIGAAIGGRIGGLTGGAGLKVMDYLGSKIPLRG